MRNLPFRTSIQAAELLNRRDRRKIVAVVCIQVSLGLLDLAGVAFMGVLGALSVSGIGSGTPGNRVNEVLNLLRIGGQPFQMQVAIIGLIATILLTSKTLISIMYARRTLHFLSAKSAEVSRSLLSKILAEPLEKVQEKTSQQTLFSVTDGVTSLMLGVLGLSIGIIADASLLLVMAVTLFLVDPIMALSTIVMFGCISIGLYQLMHTRARILGERNYLYSIKVAEKILEVLKTYREATVHNRKSYYVNEIGKLRRDQVISSAELAFMPNVSKYVIEIAVVVGALAISALQFALNDASHAIATLTVFLAAGTRIAPAALRLQQTAVMVKGNSGVAQSTLLLIEQHSNQTGLSESPSEIKFDYNGFTPEIKIDDLEFRYTNSQDFMIRNVNFEIKSGQMVAIVGPSGSGKSTLADLILGVAIPVSGKVTISEVAPDEAIRTWPGAISYVPQDVAIVSGTIRENVSLGYPEGTFSDELIIQKLRAANLMDLLDTLPDGLSTLVGEGGSKLSGGQRQRLGIARALVTSPRILLLDEATSALDGESEHQITNSLRGLAGDTTIILIAHRLSSVRVSDVVVYLDKGQVKGIGTFEEIKKSVPDFATQADLMGL
jgi:ATP-binding cassette subfamily C protein